KQSVSARLSPDLSTVTLLLDDLREAGQMYIHTRVKSVTGDSLDFEILHTMNELPANEGREILSTVK
ncbi:MAG TPA: hypothetical protein VKZ59_14850, partial [Acidobacteriota bacterium]|nr:hypothetical protein [Acidobacteriota bacterium]